MKLKFERIKLLSYCVLGIVLAGIVPTASAQDVHDRLISDTGCEAGNFESYWYSEGGRQLFDKSAKKIHAIIMGVPVYKESFGEEKAGRTLNFGERVALIDPGRSKKRMQIADLSGNPLGWVNRNDMLCRDIPLIDENSKLFRRVFVTTRAHVRGDTTGVQRTLYHSLDGRCQGGQDKCPKASRFEWYFIYAESQKKFLISFSARMNDTGARLHGWLRKQDGIPWNTAMALRPKDDLVNEEPPSNLPPNLRRLNIHQNFVCAYNRREDVGNLEKCQPVKGGDDWYYSHVRLPVLEDKDGIYKVAFSGGAQSPERAPRVPDLSGLSKLDVMFVIDGTASMQPVIDAIRGTPGHPGLVERLKQAIRSKVDGGGQYHLGFRIYRDSHAGVGDGVENSEAYVAGQGKCQNNGDEFIRHFRNVSAHDTPGDRDNEENLFLALKMAATDMGACRDFNKLIIVIGDHGYNGEMQRRRGFPAFSVTQIARRFRKGPMFKRTPTIMFIQIPSQENAARNKEKYRASYTLFEKQAKSILKEQIWKPGMSDEELRERMNALFLRIDSNNMNEQIIREIVGRLDSIFFQPALAQDISSGLRSGESLDSIIARMRGQSGTNVPGWFWDTIHSDLCAEVGRQCHSAIIDVVGKAYIKHSDKLDHDVLISKRQLEQWVDVLRIFDSDASAGRRGRAALVDAMVRKISNLTNASPDYTPSWRDRSRTMTIGEFLQLHMHLPYGFDSPSLAYTEQELKDPRKVPDCEIDHLKSNVRKKRRIMSSALNSTISYYGQRPPILNNCPNMSSKGRKVKLIIEPIIVRALGGLGNGGRSKSLSFVVNTHMFFWIPVRYFP